jgi:hypothetical protein
VEPLVPLDREVWMPSTGIEPVRQDREDGNRRAAPAGRERVDRRLVVAAVAMLGLTWSGGAAAQDEPVQTGQNALRVYLDCSAGRGFGRVCSGDLYRQEITFVNWVREPQDAQVHVIMTTQGAGGGGRRFIMDFMGREELGGMEDQLTYSSSPTDVEDETVQGLVLTMSAGLVRYAAAAGFSDAVRIVAAEPVAEGEDGAPAATQDDPWNFWVFDIDADASIETESLQESREFGFGFEANRTTEEWKLNFRADGNFEREKFELPEDSVTIHNDQDEWELSAFGVKSLGPHLGVGAELIANNSTQLNRELLVGLATGVEYNYFPYAESNRRVLLARYVVAAEAVEYQDTTIFDVLKERTYRHELGLEYDAREAWGNARIGAGASQYLDRTSAWSFRVDGFVSYRIFRGFSININGEYRKVEDQIYLSKEELEDEDILLRRRRLPTESQTELRIGLSYSFGSIYNNAVNERFSFGIF